MKKLTYLVLILLFPFCSCEGNEANDNQPTSIASDSVKTEKDTTTYIYQPDLRVGQKIERILNSKLNISTKKCAISVYDISSKSFIIQHNDKELMAPASCMKLLTAITALDRLGEKYSFCDSLFIKGEIDANGTLHGAMILKMDDDPLFWDFNQWAKAVQKRGIKRVEGNIIMHLARRDTLRPHPTDKPWDIQYHKLPLMLKGEKYIKRIFKSTLAVRGIRIKEEEFTLQDPNMNEYWASVVEENKGENGFDLDGMLRSIALEQTLHGAECIASTSHSLLEVLDPMLIYSSNIKAESMFYHLDNVYSGIWQRHSQYGRKPHEVEKFLTEKLGIDTKAEGFVINDGSGLSPENRLNADFLVKLLLWAYNNKHIRDILTREALAVPGVPGRKGSLKDRMANGFCRGRVFCKTGTLVTIGGSSLAGFIHGRNGHWYAFAIMHKDTPVWNARDFQDRICREIAR